MWTYLGIARTNKRLARARRRIEMLQREIQEQYWDFLLTPDLLELRNIAAVAELVIQGALFRRESRGLHYTADYPKTLKPARGTLLARGPDGRPRARAGSPVGGGS